MKNIHRIYINCHLNRISAANTLIKIYWIIWHMYCMPLFALQIHQNGVNSRKPQGFHPFCNAVPASPWIWWDGHWLAVPRSQWKPTRRQTEVYYIHQGEQTRVLKSGILISIKIWLGGLTVFLLYGNSQELRQAVEQEAVDTKKTPLVLSCKVSGIKYTIEHAYEVAEVSK